MSEETAYMISDMLATAATWAMGGYYNINGMRYAAKTGTTNYDEKKLEDKGLLWSGAVNDLWTVGYNTEYAIGVWYGYNELYTDYYNKLNSGQHQRLFRAVGKKVFSNKDYFEKPDTVIPVELEKENPEPTRPSKYTPPEFRITELFKDGTIPTTESTRFAKLKDVSNLTATDNNGIITLTWDEVKEPEINTEEYLRKYFDPVFETKKFLDDFINNRLSYNKNNLGTLGYNVYIKDSEENLKLLDFVTTNKYSYTAPESGEYSFVVKTAYSIFKDNMSSGKNVTTNITMLSPIIPNVPEIDSGNNDDKPDEDNNTKPENNDIVQNN